MKNKSKDRAAVPVPPPVFFFICLGAGFFLEYFFPVHIVNLSRALRIAAGGVFFLISGFLAFSAFKVFAKNKTPFDPSKSTKAIVHEGVFQFTRNPLYLSLLLLLAGFAVLFFSIWLFILIPVLFALLKYLAVLPEEAYLSEKFGQEYSDYKSNVRRWF